MKVYEAIAQTLNCHARLQKGYMGNRDMDEVNAERIEVFEKEYLPHGSGIDSGCTIDIDQWLECPKDEDKTFVIQSSYHVMNGNGYYVGWIDFKVTVTATLILNPNIDIVPDIDSSYGVLMELYCFDMYDEETEEEVDESEVTREDLEDHFETMYADYLCGIFQFVLMDDLKDEDWYARYKKETE